RPPTSTYTLSLHDALPICAGQPVAGRHAVLAALRRPVGAAVCRRQLSAGLSSVVGAGGPTAGQRAAGGAARLARVGAGGGDRPLDRKSTRLNSSHSQISYA